MILQCSGGYNTSNFDTTPIVSGTGQLQLRAAATSYIGTFPGQLRYAVAGTFVLGNDATIAGLVTISTATVLNKNGTDKTLTCNGGITMTSTLQGTALVILGGGTWSGTGALYNNTTIQGTGIISGTVTFRAGILTSVAGCNWTTTGSTLNPVASCTLNVPHITFNNIYFNVALTLNLTGNLIATGYIFIAGIAATITGAGMITTAIWRHVAFTAGTIVTLPDGATLTVTNYFDMTGVYQFAPTLKSTTPGAAAYLNFMGLPANCNICRAIFTDINASGAAQRLDNWNAGAMTNTVNIRALTTALCPDLPTTPVLSAFTRDAAAGSVTTTGAASDTIEVWGASLFDDDASIRWEKVGERVGPGAVILDFTNFIYALGGLNILQVAKVVAVARNSAGAYSAMSNVLGALTGSSAGITTSGAALSPLGSLTFTVAGLADPDDIIGWFAVNSGSLEIMMTTGNGPQTWVGVAFDPAKDNVFVGFPMDRFGHLLFMPIWIEIDAPAAGIPYMRPRQAPGAEERP
jgi:hypothetical protein